MQKELLSYFDDDLSKDIINTRIDAFTSGDVAKVFDIKLTDNQYFSKDCVALTDSEVFIDCGAYDGDSIRAFLNCTQGKYKQIIAIEPDPCNFQKLYAMAVRDDLVGFRGIKSVTGASNGTISFAVNLGTSSKVSEVNEGLDTIEMRMLKLDNLYNEKPTYIKMDIEGAELDTLKGCERIIKDLKPKLAICVYHKPFDIFDIPKYLKSLVPEYKFKLRQHQLGFCEVVLYASVD
jgi:FkbM family methyltransferase